MRIDQPFTTADAKKAGIARARLRGNGFRKLFRDCYITASAAVTLPVLIRGANRITRTQFATHHTAARVLGGAVPPTDAVHVGATGRSHTSRVEGVTVHCYSETPRLVKGFGIQFTSPVQTFLDLSGCLSLVDLVILADSLIFKGRCTPDELTHAAREFRGAGARNARQAAGLARADVESPMETRARLLIIFAGLPEPTVNHQVVSVGRARRIDLSWPELFIGVEYDGGHHRDASQTHLDLLRREDLEDDGWRFVVLVSDDIYKHPERTVHRFVRALAGAGVTVRPTDRWRVHFPS